MLEAFGITTGAGLAAGELALAEMDGAGEEAAFGGAPELTRINVITTATAVTALPIIVQKSARPRCIGPPRRSCLSLGKRNILSVRWHWPTPTAFGPFWTVALRDQLRSIPPGRRARICAAVTCPAGADRLTRITCQALIRLVQRAVALTEVADGLEAQIAAIAGDMAPGLAAAGTASARSPPRRSCCRGPPPGASAPRPPSPCSRAPPGLRPSSSWQDPGR